jgi:S-adenosylmethionine decarboxylase
VLKGCEWVVEARGCRVEPLEDPAGLARLCDRIVAELGLKVLGRPQWHQFPGPKGVTGLYLLAESHLAVHTFPEHELATFNLFCCRPRPAWPWQARLADHLGATRVDVRELLRGAT